MMPAAKMMDPVMGIDIHIIQPPGPVPPLPIPHPFVGMLFDPMELAPLVGASVFINGMPKATAGSEGKAMPPHIPIGGMFVPPPPGNECEMFMGSATVLFEGEPASYTGLPALSCQSVGMPSPPRAKKKPKPILKLPTSVVLPIPAGPPVLIGGPPTISMSVIGMKVAMGALGKAAGKLKKMMKASKKVKKVSDKIHKAAGKAMKKLGVPPSVQNKVHKGVCTVTGHPVDVATGKVFTDKVDFELPGPIPLRWERTWYSSSIYRGPLGHGWHHSLDMALLEDGRALAVRMADGRPVAFPRLSVGQEIFDRREKLTLRRDGQGYSLRDKDGLNYRFAPHISGKGECPLIGVSNGFNQRILLAYSAKGDIETIQDSAGRTFQIHSDGNGRILEIRGPHPDHPHQSVLMMAYEYDVMGNLVVAKDAMGLVWKFAYEEHLLVTEIDRAGYAFHFDYESKDKVSRCVRTWGDGGLYERRLRYDVQKKQTVIVDSRSGESIYTWDDSGLVVKETDALGNSREYRFNEHGDKIAEIDPCGGSTGWEFDDLGRLIKIIFPSGASNSFSFDESGRVIKTLDRDGGEWNWRYPDSRKTVVVDPLGHESTVEFTETGLPSSRTDFSGRRTEMTWTQAGQIGSVIHPDGTSEKFEYDAIGNLRAKTAPDGRLTTYRYDFLGRLQGSESEDLHSLYRHDAEGNLVSRETSPGFRHDYRFGPVGLLSTMGMPGLTPVRLDYDNEGELAGLRNSASESWTLTRDQAGRLISETSFDGRRQNYEYDAAGRPIAIRSPSGSWVECKWNPEGKLIERRLSSGGEEQFGYDPSGRLVSAKGPDSEVTWEYDHAGRVVSETSNGRTIRSEHDPDGRRIRRTFADGHSFEFVYDPLGNLSTISDGSGDLLAFEYGPASMETARRFKESIIRRTSYGGGRMQSATVLHSGTVKSRVSYRFGPHGLVSEKWDSALGISNYHHDRLGRLESVSDGSVRLEDFFHDESGNVSGVPKIGGISGEAPGWHLLFDPDGNLIEKWNDHEKLRFSYDSLGRLIESIRNSEHPVKYAYDPLGRRISKTSGIQETLFIWDGERLAGEIKRDLRTGSTVLREYLFRKEGFEPLLLLESGTSYFFECDHLGTPLRLWDASGEKQWEGDFSAFGGMRSENKWPISVDLRFPGQYYDQESDLHFNRFRYYDPALRMYTSPDPIGFAGGLQLWNYVPSPADWIDPYGLSRTCGGCKDCALPDSTLVRRGSSYESAGRLDRQAKEAQKHGFPHGVSVTTPESNLRLSRDPSDASSTMRQSFEEGGFKVHHTPTTNDPLHHTVQLPDPVTPEVAEKFNSILGRSKR